MGCCSVTQRHTGVDEVGPDEIELLEIPWRQFRHMFKNLLRDSMWHETGTKLMSAMDKGSKIWWVWSPGETRLQLSVRNSRDEQPLHYPSIRHMEQEVVLWGRTRDELHHRIYSQQPISGWEGQPPHMYGEIIHSSLVSLYNSYSQETSEHFLVLFSFHLLILSLDHSRQDLIYEGILPLSGLTFQAASVDPDTSHSPHMFEISGPMVDSKVFICSSAAELQKWKQQIEDRRFKSMTKPMSPSLCALSYLLPCDVHWKREELLQYLLQAPIWQWEGSPIQHMGQPGYISPVHIINSQRQGPQERLMVLFPHDILLLSVEKQLNIRYEGRLPRQGIRAVEQSAFSGRLEFELIGELVEPLQVSCTCLEDYQNWIFQLQQPDRSSHTTVSQAAPPIMPKLHRSRKESRGTDDTCRTVSHQWT